MTWSSFCRGKHHQKELRWSISIGKELFHFCPLKPGHRIILMYMQCMSRVVLRWHYRLLGLTGIWGYQDNLQNSVQLKYQYFFKNSCFNSLFQFVTENYERWLPCHCRKLYDKQGGGLTKLTPRFRAENKFVPQHICFASHCCYDINLLHCSIFLSAVTRVCAWEGWARWSKSGCRRHLIKQLFALASRGLGNEISDRALPQRSNIQRGN